MSAGTVDEGIHALAARKLRLDAAVLEGVTSSAAGGARTGAGADAVQACALQAAFNLVMFFTLQVWAYHEAHPAPSR